MTNSFRINRAVLTPLGKGIVQGRWSETQWLVRLPINDVTSPRLRESLTPRAKNSGLWVFTEDKLQ